MLEQIYRIRTIQHIPCQIILSQNESHQYR
nr:MAG TPA: putative SPOUT methyltransferase [Caudoviricetes sp.]